MLFNQMVCTQVYGTLNLICRNYKNALQEAKKLSPISIEIISRCLSVTESQHKFCNKLHDCIKEVFFTKANAAKICCPLFDDDDAKSVKSFDLKVYNDGKITEYIKTIKLLIREKEGEKTCCLAKNVYTDKFELYDYGDEVDEGEYFDFCYNYHTTCEFSISSDKIKSEWHAKVIEETNNFMDYIWYLADGNDFNIIMYRYILYLSLSLGVSKALFRILR